MTSLSTLGHHVHHAYMRSTGSSVWNALVPLKQVAGKCFMNQLHDLSTLGLHVCLAYMCSTG